MKIVKVTYWHNGIEYKKRVKEHFLELEIKTLKMLNVSRIRINDYTVEAWNKKHAKGVNHV